MRIGPLSIVHLASQPLPKPTNHINTDDGEERKVILPKSNRSPVRMDNYWTIISTSEYLWYCLYDVKVAYKENQIDCHSDIDMQK